MGFLEEQEATKKSKLENAIAAKRPILDDGHCLSQCVTGKYHDSYRCHTCPRTRSCAQTARRPRASC